MGSGSVILNIESNHPSSSFSNSFKSNYTKANNTTGLLNQPFALRNVEIELNLSNNLKHWKAPKEYKATQHYHQQLQPSTMKTNMKTSVNSNLDSILLFANVGCYYSTGMLREASHLITVLEGEELAQRVLLIPQFKPTLYDCLVASGTSGTGATASSEVDEVNADAYDVENCGNSVVRLDASVWHATVDDLQLTSVR